MVVVDRFSSLKYPGYIGQTERRKITFYFESIISKSPPNNEKFKTLVLNYMYSQCLQYYLDPALQFIVLFLVALVAFVVLARTVLPLLWHDVVGNANEMTEGLG